MSKNQLKRLFSHLWMRYSRSDIGLELGDGDPS
jgi:hypothetical protein